MPTLPPLPTEAMAQSEKTKHFLDELFEVSLGQVKLEDLPLIRAYIAQHPAGLWVNYEGNGDDSMFKVYDVEFLEADGEDVDRIRVVFACYDERSSEWEEAGEETILLK